MTDLSQQKKIYLAELLGTCTRWLDHAHQEMNDGNYHVLAGFTGRASHLLSQELAMTEKQTQRHIN